MSDTPLDNEKDILLSIAEGDSAAFKHLFDQYRHKVYSFAFSHTRSEVLADEITQEVFIKVWTGGDKLKEIQVFNAWLKTVTRNLTYSYLRKLKTERQTIAELSGIQPFGHYSTDHELAVNELKYLLQQALSRMTDQQRSIYIMSREENMSYSEIARTLHISEHTVNYHLKNVLRQLREALGDRLDVILCFISTAIFHF